MKCINLVGATAVSVGICISSFAGSAEAQQSFGSASVRNTMKDFFNGCIGQMEKHVTMSGSGGGIQWFHGTSRHDGAP